MTSHKPVSRPCAGDKVRESARELFYKEGIRAVGIEEIVERAGVTKPSLYRAFGSKDGLTTAYLCDFHQSFQQKLDNICHQYPGDPRAQLQAYFDDLSRRASQPGFRGCGITNAAIEFPDADHPVRREAQRLKEETRTWLREKVAGLNAADPAFLTDSLIVLMEGAYVCGQAFKSPGPAAQVGRLAHHLLETCCVKTCPEAGTSVPSARPV
ncbi:TetR/AcrR family transcriptional regulator [Komagataeibacter sp. FXV3]|uniref:TetR/AcrR family transcriptional regulator n=1 Tax=Komagataeibacter sp. FXV3 TaxID=2608998 RepID=UPI00187B23C5|nr:TetR/AcrR family transcriptional regulator [Komagataeibacter sp. FXV3]MBE7731306.1 TetR/AcrR family transcriptional regulator [Komagataeibacter sp. FXV3]